MRWALAVFVAVLCAACGGGNDGDGGTRDIPAKVRADSPTIITSSKNKCHFDGDRQVFASGVVRNGGDGARHVNIEVRFLDADDVRIEKMSDSVSALERGESARWGVSFYPDRPDDVVLCEITTLAS